MIGCSCPGDRGLPLRTRVWHGAYCRWYDHRQAGHRHRAAAWGWIADRLVRFA